jgi:uncharacterized protein YkwD
MRGPKRLIRVLPVILALVLASALSPAAASASFCGESSRAPAQLTGHQMRTSVLCLVNAARERHGRRRLEFSRSLRGSATALSLGMVRTGTFSHYVPGVSTMIGRATRFGYLSHPFRYRVAENIAAGAGRRYGSPLAIVRSWMRSAPHRANILDPRLRDFGAGIARGDALSGAGRGATYTLDFGARR